MTNSGTYAITSLGWLTQYTNLTSFEQLDRSEYIRIVTALQSDRISFSIINVANISKISNAIPRHHLLSRKCLNDFQFDFIKLSDNYQYTLVKLSLPSPFNINITF